MSQIHRLAPVIKLQQGDRHVLLQGNSLELKWAITRVVPREHRP
ncbi:MULTISPECIES: hypothetical protein [Paenibacillus]|nr:MULTISPECIES: hypothetical protein [Paenibacillus]